MPRKPAAPYTGLDEKPSRTLLQAEKARRRELKEMRTLAADLKAHLAAIEAAEARLAAALLQANARITVAELLQGMAANPEL